MSKLKITLNDILSKNAEDITNELMKGTYVIIADTKPKLLLQNVLHYQKSKKSLEIYTLFECKTEKYNLRFQYALYMPNDVKKSIYDIVAGSLSECDAFIADRHGNLNTKTVYGKSGNVYQIGR